MMLRQRGGKVAALACALGLFVLGSMGSSANAAPRASDLGPEAPMAEPSGGFVGQLKVAPSRGPVGTPVTVTGQGFPAEQELQLVWRTVKGSWKVTSAEYHGREFTPAAYQFATVKSDKSGHISASFVAPEDFGFLHDVVIQQGARLLTQTAFNLDIAAKIVGAQSGPVGSPIAIEVQGIGWRELEGSWVLLYDNMFTGFMSVVTTQGTARLRSPLPDTRACTSSKCSIPISARPIATRSSRRCPTVQTFDSTTRSPRVRRRCRRRLSDKRRRTSAGLRRQAIWLRCLVSRASALQSS